MQKTQYLEMQKHKRLTRIARYVVQNGRLLFDTGRMMMPLGHHVLRLLRATVVCAVTIHRMAPVLSCRMTKPEVEGCTKNLRILKGGDRPIGIAN